ncbi:MAG: aldehyde ferredoxin oxidoreductase N-terminal domain-containing protein [Dehalococcoidia bacterium]
MPQPYGYAGNILRSDLSTGKIWNEPTEAYSAFLGGRGLAAIIYWNEVPPEVKPFDDENRLIIALGPLAGIPVIGASRWGVFGRSPQTDPPKFSYSNLGGRWGAELKLAGYDAVVLQGKSDSPVYMLIQDAKVELRDASMLWGKGAAETREILKEELGNSVRVLAIGPAGENMVATASLLADNDASGSAGMGAVMGSKMLKAVVVAGSRKDIRVARPDELRELTGYYKSLNRGAFTAWGNDFIMSGPTTKKDPCYGCLGDCIRVKYTGADGQAGKYMCQSGMFYIQWSWRYYGEQNEVPFYANRVCDDYGLDTWSLELMIGWLNRCYKAGLITEEGSGLPVSKLGSLEYIETLARMVALREGIGDILAKGMDAAAKEIGGESPKLIRHVDPYDPRIYITTAMLWAIEPREPIQSLHEVGMPLAKWVNWAKDVEGAYLSTDVLRAIARRFWGSEAAADFSSFDGKALAARMIQDRQYAKECLVVCDWLYPVIDIENSDDHVGDPALESRLLSAVTGEEVDENGLYTIGERVLNTQRAILVREGHRGRVDDTLPEEWHTRPLKYSPMDPECLVPGANGEVISRIGSVIDRQEFEKVKDEYYQLRGWGVEKGFQKRETLQRLGLNDLSIDLEKRGLLE